MLFFGKNDNNSHNDSKPGTRTEPFCDTFYNTETNLVYINAAFNPEYMQKVLGALSDATGTQEPISLISGTQMNTPPPGAVSIDPPPPAKDKEYDVFISYAGSDYKYVLKIVTELKKKGIRVWFDEDIIQWSDSHFPKIDQGIANSKYILVVLSPNYIDGRHKWAQTELYAAFETEIFSSARVIPLQHHLTSKEVQDFSPILASRGPINTALNRPAKIAKMIQQLLDNEILKQ